MHFEALQQLHILPLHGAATVVQQRDAPCAGQEQVVEAVGAVRLVRRTTEEVLAASAQQVGRVLAKPARQDLTAAAIMLCALILAAALAAVLPKYTRGISTLFWQLVYGTKYTNKGRVLGG